MRRFMASRPGVAAFLLGAATALALPPLHLLPLLLATIPAFLWLLWRARGARQALWWGALFGFGHHLAGLYWVTHALFTEIERWFWLVPLAAPALALPLAMFTALPAWAAWRAGPGWPGVLAFAGAWTLAEMLRGVLFTGFPWNLLGTAWAFHALPIQPAQLIGTHGLSLITLLLAGLPVLGWRRAAPLLATGIAAWAGFGAWALQRPVPSEVAARIVLVQGNVPQDVKWEEAQRVPIFRRYLQLSAEAAARATESHPGQPVLVIWPETASPFLLTQDAAAREAIAAALPPGALLLAGSVRAAWDGDGRLSRLWNSMVTLDSEGVLGPVYDKAHLVPFGEYMPLGGLLPIRVVTGGLDFSAGPGRVTLSLPGVPAVSPLICYEVIFSGRVVGTERPGWLLNLTNDAWFGHSAGPYQHLAAARLRAVEEGLPLVRAAQTGISAVFDASGREVVRLALGAMGSIETGLPGAAPPTAFARHGLALPLGLAALLLLLGLAAGRRKRVQVGS